MRFLLFYFGVFVLLTLTVSGQSTNYECLRDESKGHLDSCRFKDVSLRLETTEGLYKESTTTFLVGEKVFVRIIGLQKGEKSIGFPAKNRFIRYYPVLLKNGVELSLLPSVADNIKSVKKQEEEKIRGGGLSIQLIPHKETEISWLDLTEWFGLLEKGVYTLKINFKVDNETLESVTVAFEVKNGK